MHSSYNLWLVALSVLTSIFASFTALSLAARIRRASGKARGTWLLLAAVAMGGGIWAMHFIAMLAFHTEMPVSYDVGLTLFSLVLAIVFTGVGQWLVATKGSGAVPLLIGGIAMGLGVNTMHYTGMAAMRMPAHISYDLNLVALSVAIAIVAGTAALWLCFNLSSLWARLLSALIMSAAVCGMHYTGMAAARYETMMHGDMAGTAMSSSLLAIAIGVATFAILCLALLLAIVDQRFEARAMAEADRARKGEHRFQSLIQNAVDVIMVIDAEGTISFVSPSVERILGYAPEALLGSTPGGLIPPGEQSRLRDLVHELRISPQVNLVHEFRLVHASGRQGDFEVVSNNLLDDPAVGGIVVNIRDISTRRENALLERGIAERTAELSRANAHLTEEIAERSQAQEDLRRAHAELERKVEERTRELQTAKDIAEQASLAKSQFLANMSHELRTPLNAVIGYSEMLYEDAEAEGRDEQMADLAKIRGAGKHLLSLINDILDLSKIEAGRMDLHLEPVQLDCLLKEVSTTCEPLMARGRNTFLVACTEELGVIRGDAVKLRQSLLNVLGNAAKFTANGEVTLIAERIAEGGREWVRFAVQDTGIGIAEQDQKKLFNNFAQINGTTSRQHDGTGLGLAISQRLCTLMGGGITVESELGRGSTFIIQIPADRLDSPEKLEALSVPASTASLDAATRGRGLAVVIDDDPAARDLVGRMLMKEGFRSAHAGTAESGIALAREVRPDIIILDVIMPGTTGWEALQMLKADPELCSCPVVMLTMLDEREKGLELGATDYLIKPIDRDTLVAVINRCGENPAEKRVILVCGDDPGGAGIADALDQEAWVVETVPTAIHAAQRIAVRPPDVVVFGLSVPLPACLTSASQLVTSWPELPVIVVAQREGELRAEPSTMSIRLAAPDRIAHEVGRAIAARAPDRGPVEAKRMTGHG